MIEGTEVCDDGNTDDGDGCSSTCSVEGDTCAAPIDLANFPGSAAGQWAFSGDTSSFTDNYDGSCRSTLNQPDAVFAFTAPQAANYHFRSVAVFDHVFWALGGTCGSSSELACSDVGLANDPEEFVVPLAAGETTWIVVAGYSASGTSSNFGTFDLAVEQVVCGDGLVAFGETCDDGNDTGGDGCSAFCATESGFACPATGGACHPIVCGDGIIDRPESCEDGNTVDGDGCSSTCRVEGVVVETEPNDGPTNFDVLPVPGVGMGDIDMITDFYDTWQVDLTAGTTYVVTTASAPDGSCGATTAEDTWMIIWDDIGDLAGFGFDISSNNWCSQSVFTALSSGSYQIDVMSESDDPIPVYYLFVEEQ